MKLFILYILCISLLNPIHTNAIQKNQYITSHQNGEQSFTLYAKYFIMKEFCKICLNAPFMNLEKINLSSIYCCKSHHKHDAKSLWVWLIFEFDEISINELKKHIYNDSVEELREFILKKYQELRLFCPHCQEYSSDYYIPNKQNSQKSN